MIQKYGGSSLSTAGHVLSCARRIVETKRGGNEVVVVVSAMGDSTDDLLALAGQINPSPDQRSLDLLLASGEQVSAAVMGMAINAIGGRFGCVAAAMNVMELGIYTDGDHCEAQIERVDIRQIEAELNDGRIVIVPGFQGLTPMGHIATLGRGGSDITAVALAAALRKRDPDLRCEIYTDVDGVFTADPNQVAGSMRMDALSHDDMIELATAGAKVLHPRSAMLARQAGIEVEVKLSPSQRQPHSDDGRGTRIVPDGPRLETQRVIGCTAQRNLVRLNLTIPNAVGSLLWDLAQSVIEHLRPVELIAPQVNQAGGSTSMQLTVQAADTDEAEGAAARVLHNVPGSEISRRGPLAAVVVVGRCMLGEPQILTALREAAASMDDPVQIVALSDRRITLMTTDPAANALLRRVHAALAERGLFRLSPAVQESNAAATAEPRVLMTIDS